VSLLDAWVFNFKKKGGLIVRKIIIFKRFLLFLMTLMFVAGVLGCGSSDDEVTNTTSTYSISGTVTGDVVQGVTVSLAGASTETTTTDADGKYSFTGLANGSYTVTPTLAGYVFTPTSKAVVVYGSDMIADFVATASAANTYSISGKVSGAVAQGVRIDLSGDNTGSVITAADGTYTFAGLLAGDYTVTPYLSGYVFDPDYRDVTLSANSIGNDFTAEASRYSQADLVGTWNVHRLEAGDSNGWGRYTVDIDEEGTLDFKSCKDNTGNTDCPDGPVVWTMADTTTGEISQSVDGTETYTWYSMTSDPNKSFIAGTGRGSSQLFIAQRKVEGVSYSNDDLKSKNFVVHSLKVGESNRWEYDTGHTDANRQIITDSCNEPEGSCGTGETGMTISVDANGIVTITGSEGMTDFEGFLSADKKTIVATFTDDINSYQLMIIQITGKTYTAGSLPDQTWYGHILGVSEIDEDAYRVFYKASISGGTMTFADWQSDPPGISSPSATATTIDSTGKITLAGISSYHGQMSDNGYFSVGTMTIGVDPSIYALNINTR